MDLYIKYMFKEGAITTYNIVITSEEQLKDFMNEAIVDEYIIVEVINNHGY